MKPLKVKVSITLDEDLVERVRSASEADGRSFSQYVNEALRQGLRHPRPEQEGEYGSNL